MSDSVEDWTIRYKVDTKAIDAALKKVETLRKAMDGLHGVNIGVSSSSNNTSAKRQAYSNESEIKRQQRDTVKQEQEERKRAAQAIRLERQNRRDAIRDTRLDIAERRTRLQLSRLERQERQATLSLEEKASKKKLQDAYASAGYVNHNNMLRANYERQLNRDYRLDTSRFSAMSRLDAAADRRARAGLDTHPQFGDFRERIAGASTTSELSRVNAEMRQFIRYSDQAAREQARITRQVERSSFAARSLNSSMKNMARSYLSVYALGAGGHSLYQNSKEVELMKTGLIMGTGSKQAANKEFIKIRKLADESGMDLGTAVDLYSQISMNAKDTGMNNADKDNLFRGINTMSLGFGLDKTKQKLVAKSFTQMLSKQSVQAEEFKNQLGDAAPGVMGMLATAMGLGTGPEAMKKLTQLMKQGKIGMEDLKKFTALAEKRALDSGAYQNYTQSKEAAENRLGNAYKVFSDTFMNFFDKNIKGSFNSLADTMNHLSEVMSKVLSAEKEYGIFSAQRDMIDGIVEAFKTFGEVLQLALEVLWEIYSRTTGAQNGGLKGYLADREMEGNYFKSKGVYSETEKASLRRNGMPGYQQYIIDNAMSVGASRNDAYLLSTKYMDRAGLTGDKYITSYDPSNISVDPFSGPSFAQQYSLNQHRYQVAPPNQTISPTFYFTIQKNEDYMPIWADFFSEMKKPSR